MKKVLSSEDGWMDGGWMDLKAGLRIAYSNQKLKKDIILYGLVLEI